MPFALPSLKLEGLVRASTGNRLYVVALDLGEESIDADVARFVLVAEDGKTYEPIGAGGGPDLIVPLDRIPIGTEVGEILPSDAIVSMRRRSATSVALEVAAGRHHRVPVSTASRRVRPRAETAGWPRAGDQAMNDAFPFADLRLSQRLERAEALANARFVEARARQLSGQRRHLDRSGRCAGDVRQRRRRR